MYVKSYVQLYVMYGMNLRYILVERFDHSISSGK